MHPVSDHILGRKTLRFSEKRPWDTGESMLASRGHGVQRADSKEGVERGEAVRRARHPVISARSS